MKAIHKNNVCSYLYNNNREYLHPDMERYIVGIVDRGVARAVPCSPL